MRFEDLNVLSVGNTRQLVGMIYQGEEQTLLCFLPGERNDLPVYDLEMNPDQWKVFVQQSDHMETEVLERAKDGSLTKMILRKSQRQLDAVLSWRVFKRDNYTCRYCGRNDVPLTVDHLVRWEEGGPTIEENLLSACRKCNRVRGDTPYDQWLRHPRYLRLSEGLPCAVREENLALVTSLAGIPRCEHVRSR